MGLVGVYSPIRMAKLCENRECLKYIAIIAMCADHIGVVLFPGHIWLRYVGRLAFPLYAYLIATGYDLASNRRNYALRLFLLACLSQLGFMLHRPWWQLNIIFTFCLAVVALQCWETSRKGKMAAVAIACLTVAISWFSMALIQWGGLGFLTVVSFRIMGRRKIVGVAIFVALMAIPTTLWAVLQGGHCWYQCLSILALPVIWWTPDNFKYRINPYVWRLFYPVHWFLLALCKLIIAA